MKPPSIVWFRQDLRVSDQAALLAAAGEGPVIPLYVLDDEAPGAWRIGGAQRWWLANSLRALAGSLEGLGSRLILRRGPCADVIAQVAEAGAGRVHAIRHYEPWWSKAEADVAARLPLELHDGNQLLPPRDIASGSGEPFKVYSAYWRALSAHMPPPEPVAAPSSLEPATWPSSDALDDWELEPAAPDWASTFGPVWQPGEAGALERAAAFAEKVCGYERTRNLPSEEGTAALSPHLHHGEISPVRLWHEVAGRPDAEKFLKELAWRDFATGVIRARPDYATTNGRLRFDRLQWREGADADRDFLAWTKGRTGYPIVDAGMRQLWRIGWMHNRVRMITASFLVKHLLIDWRRGERWFWDTLVDANYANNSVNWQWVAGSGIDANMFSRIMAPLVQSERFDAAGYLRTWVPELATLGDEVIHDPHAHGVAPPGYPAMLIGHREGRERALAAGRNVVTG